MEIKLGCKARDKVTGFTGIVTGRAEYLYGCTQYCIIPPAIKGDAKDGQWYDEGRIEVIGKGILPKDVTGSRPGGPNREAPKVH